MPCPVRARVNKRTGSFTLCAESKTSFQIKCYCVREPHKKKKDNWEWIVWTHCALNRNAQEQIPKWSKFKTIFCGCFPYLLQGIAYRRVCFCEGVASVLDPQTFVWKYIFWLFCFLVIFRKKCLQQICRIECKYALVYWPLQNSLSKPGFFSCLQVQCDKAWKQQCRWIPLPGGQAESCFSSWLWPWIQSPSRCCNNQPFSESWTECGGGEFQVYHCVEFRGYHTHHNILVHWFPALCLLILNASLPERLCRWRVMFELECRSTQQFFFLIGCNSCFLTVCR